MSIDPRRRDLLKLVGASAAFGTLGLRSGSAQAVAAGAREVVDIAIVGAGPSGLTTARDLERAGCESFVVLEARSRVGGRTLNHDLGSGYVADAGGEWIGPGQTAVADLARELGVRTAPTYYKGKTVILGGEGRVAIDFDGGFGSDHTIADRLTELAQQVPSEAPWTSPRFAEFDRTSVGEWLVKQGIEPKDRAGWDMAIALSGGSSPAKTSLLQYLSTINSGGSFERVEKIKDSAQETHFEGGAQVLSLRMAEALRSKVRLSCPVRRICDWDRDVIRLHTDRGELRARCVVMALHPALCNQIEFSPALPEKRAALQRDWPAFSPLRKTAMVFARPFWREEGLNGHVMQLDGPVLWAYDRSPRGAEVGVISAFVKAGHLPSDREAARRMQADIYARALGRKALTPLSYHDHDWATADEWAMTCLPAVPPGFWSKHADALRMRCGHLVWSGTETADRWVGYIDGAVSAGHRAARQALFSLLRMPEGAR